MELRKIATGLHSNKEGGRGPPSLLRSEESPRKGRAQATAAVGAVRWEGLLFGPEVPAKLLRTQLERLLSALKEPK